MPRCGPLARACADPVERGQSLYGSAGQRSRDACPECVSARPMATRTVLERYGTRQLMPNVRAKLPAEAGAVSLVRDDAPSAADQAYSACRSGSA
jgi:hypothetical protein